MIRLDGGSRVLQTLLVSVALAAITSTTRAQATPTCSGSVTYEAESITHSTGGPTPGGWNIWSAGYVSTEHDFAAGATTFTLVARGTPLAGVWPHVKISVGGVEVGSKTIPSATWDEYTFAINAQAGKQELRVTFDNDDLSETEDRNLFVDKLVVGCGTPTEVDSSSVPTEPIPFNNDAIVELNSGTPNWAYIPKSYDRTHQTPTVLFVWLHGCGGTSSGDIWLARPRGDSQHWLSLTVGGREKEDGVSDGCWKVDSDVDVKKVLAAIEDVKKHFNIDPKRVILGGFSSGGDLTYLTAFHNAELFAGVLVANSAPFPHPGLPSQDASLADIGSSRFHVAHLAHRQDGTYPIGDVNAELDALEAKMFDVHRIVLDGPHWDPTLVNVPGITGQIAQTNADIMNSLFQFLDDGWTTP